MRAVGYSRCLLCSALCALTLCVTSAPSYALEPGVHADPGSPAEKEYVLPLDQARGTGGEASSPHSSTPHLFGAGIKPPRGGASGGETGGDAGKTVDKGAAPRAGAKRGAVRASGARGGAAAGGQGSTLPDAVLRASHSQDSPGKGSLLVLIGGGIAILVVGAFGGTVLRHSRRPTRPTPSR